MEAALAANDALDGRLAYVTHPNVVAKLKKTKVDAGSGRFLVEGMLDPVKTANGYNIYSTTVSKKTTGTPDTYGILFGNFSDVQIGFWGGVVAYYFGSSAGSKEKTEAMNRMARK